MVTFEYKTGFWFIYRDGQEIANTGMSFVDRATSHGFRTGDSLERVCTWIGGDVLAAYNEKFPKGPKMDDKAIRRKYFRRGSMMRGY